MQLVLWLALSLALPAMAENAPSCRLVFQVGLDTGDRLTGLVREAAELRRERDRLRTEGLPTKAVDERLAMVKRQTGLRLITGSLRSAAEKLNEIIITRHYNDSSLRNLARSTAPKPMSLSVKTVRGGPVAGYVPRDPRVSEPNISPERLAMLDQQIEDLVAKGELKVIRLGEFDADTEAGNVQILADGHGHPITSDVDLWGVLRQGASNPVRYVEGRGWVGSADEVTIDLINQHFRIQDTREFKRDLVRHGPWIAHPEAKETDYPLWAFVPNGQIRLLRTPQELQSFLEEAALSGYKL